MGKVAKEETLQGILTQLRFIAAGQKRNVYADIAGVAHLIGSGTLESNRALFPVGDSFVIPWKDMDDSNHNSGATAYQTVWDIVSHRTVTLENGDERPAMLLQMHCCTPYLIQFSAPQAAYCAVNGLAAGTYKLAIGANANGYAQGDLLEFAITDALPENGRLYIGAKSGNVYPVTAYGADGKTVLENTSASVVSSSAAADLGATDDGTNNSALKMLAGSNRWKESAVRQWLNAKGQNWFCAQGAFDLVPTMGNKRGFMTGFDEAFLSAAKPVLVRTATDLSGGYDESFDRFFLPSVQEMNVTPQVMDAEGAYFEYWREKQGASAYVGTGSGSAFDCFKIDDVGGAGPRTMFLRSANVNGSYAVRKLINSGCVAQPASAANYYASGQGYTQPVCAIC